MSARRAGSVSRHSSPHWLWRRRWRTRLHRGIVWWRALGRADPPLYAAVFVLAGAELVPSSVLGLGLIGLGYTTARTAGKILGARIGLRGQDVPDLVRQQIGYCLISSSSLVVGLTIQIRTAFPAYAATITGIVLAAVVIFEVVGPLLTRRALFATGEARPFLHRS